MTRARKLMLVAAAAVLVAAGVAALYVNLGDDPVAAPVSVEHAIAHFQLQEYEAALGSLRGLADSDRNDWRVPYYTGATLIKLKDYEAAAPALEEALLQNPGEADIPFALGVVYFKLGNLALAKGYFASTVEIDPGHAEARGLMDTMANLERMQPDNTEETGNWGLPFFSLKKTFRLLASLKVAIPLLVLLTVVTIVGSLFPEPDLFWSNAYLGLLGLLGVSLLLITIQHAPLILKRKGRNAMIGVIATHLGILVLIAGVIYGGYTGFRNHVRLIEGQITVVPGLPFVISLDELHVEKYSQEDFPRMNLAVLPMKRQDSSITLLKQGKPWRSMVVAPGSPTRVDGITLLPDLNDIGWYFELFVTDRRGREKTIPVRPWDLPLIKIGERQIVVHGAIGGEFDEVELFAIDDEQIDSLGFAGRTEALEIDGSQFRLGKVSRYTGMQIYNRPQEPILIFGSVLMFLGLVWHFYFRHRDRRREGKSDA